ncbi:MAG: M15 family metallopeptidase [Haliscomenobacter sp.]|uniref:M15 family metallopeptidase n=1 Tax=Haliscomenobacter sp. TaxID=2717303 RepID=UPI0029A12F70|nr:M15 family metallopeptidase [Haliscomenobacter sp.]MDX2071765.1 M15 family metallopeptidase [Haliscomenobacter sp.]
MQKLLPLIVVWASFVGLQGQSCGLKVVNTLDGYRQKVVENADNELVEIIKVIPSVKLDIKYATKDNLVHQRVYKQARAFARKPVVEALQKIQAELNTQGLGIKVFDGYRPYAVTCLFYAAIRDTTFVAAPWRGSRHNRGCALDLTLINLKTGKELPMPSGYDETTERAFHDYQGGTEEERKNRAILREVMTKHGFAIYKYEWWHYDFIGFERFDITDIPFEELSK